MVYLINKLVIFSEKDSAISWVNRQEEATSLSLPIAKLLKTLLNNPAVTLSKDFLLSAVLEENSLSPSMNNLNNYISLLRKTLREYDLADLLMTVPKVGIVFNTTDIEIVCDETLSPKVADEVFKPVNSKWKEYWGYAVFIGGGILVALILLVSGIISSDFPDKETFRDFTIKDCRLFYLDDDLSPGDFPKKYSNLCEENARVYYYSRNITLPNIITREEKIIFACKKEGKRCSTYVYIKS
ncbi:MULTISPECIES: helix-turn-helix domain-containing protein [unclassified Brenneria]|uniref:winged helix-turn-helix domain-containing protein n=1 Tax=unclassified Brenneria TaxID=2634434 RepID=UPI0029C331BF|nr:MULTISPECIES: helix-turn-helix domain-containing protein [unclassified Brenneria]MDX5627901.1 helix-turn-helix domain-containing protein [Brenneria sp. L3-3Z]MDX5694739.1 helix-turn-helix domain-containing protein [Brenneria sp. L4-2C]MEE3660527.1 helix-turn-helix domain-containing protein [Brenneria sp. g21c3]